MLLYDESEEIGGIRYQGISTYVSLLDDRPYVRFCSVLMGNVDCSEELLMRLNDLNSENGHMHLFIQEGDVIALSDVLAVPFVPSHMAHALGNFCQIADNHCRVLQMEFCGDSLYSDQPQQLH